MSFLAPLMFWSAAALVPALLLLYFLKLRRREQEVPSTLLWKRAIQDLQVNAPFQKLRKNLLLFLQLLVLLAGVFALARPVVESTVRNEKSVILLIDRSASMKTVEADGRTRMEDAREQAVRYLRTLNQTGSRWFSFTGIQDKTRAMVIAFADRATVVAPFTTSTGELIDRVEQIEATDERTNLSEALQLAEAYMAQTTIEQNPVPTQTGSKLLLISDGAIGDLKEAAIRSGSMELLKIGAATDNVAITALRTRRNYEAPEQVDVLIRVENFGDQPVKTDVSLYVDGTLQNVANVSLGAAERDSAAAVDEAPAPAPTDAAEMAARSLTISLPINRAATIEARIARDDALMVDNRAYAVVPPPRRMRVLVVTAGNLFIEVALRGLPLESVVYMTPSDYEQAPLDKLAADGRSKFDVVIVDKHSTQRLPTGNYLFFGSVPQVAGVKAEPGVDRNTLIPFDWWDENHPALRYVKLEYVDIGRLLALTLPEEAQVLAETREGVAIARYSAAGSNFLIVGFAAEGATWVRRVSLSVFIYNVVRYLGGAAAGDVDATIHPGEALTIPLPAGKDAAQLRTPAGDEVELRADASGLARFARTDRVGVYQVVDGVAGRDTYAVNLENPRESDIRPPAQIAVRGQAVAETSAIKTETPEIWRWFVATALLVMLLEWYIYNRRVMV